MSTTKKLNTRRRRGGDLVLFRSLVVMMKMRVPKLPVALIVLSLLFVAGWADVSAELDADELRSTISNLESTLSIKLHELNSKDEQLTTLKKVIEDKSATISVLQSEIESIKKEDAADSKELITNANALAAELEKQVEKLMNEIESEKRKKDILEFQAREMENKLEELNLKINNLQKTNHELELKMEKIQYALQVAEEKLMSAQLEAAEKLKELAEVTGAWLPSWLAVHISCCQELIMPYWEEHGQPVLDVFLQKMSEKSGQAQKFLEPHLERAKSEWLPVIREHWITFAATSQPVVKRIHSRTIDLYNVTKNNVESHIVKVQELADPYYQEAKKLSKPYIDQMASISKPHVERLQVVIEPYKKHAVHVYGKFLESATICHQQVQAGILVQLNKYEITESLATKELVWFMSSALLALPIFLVYRLMSDIFCDTKTESANASMNQAHRRHKRRHVDK